ncbi:MAG: 50S ribosomal protein L9, partial [Planctomycetota bacterium]
MIIMKLLLIEDVESLGWLGDIVEVKTGYARNYLVPQGLAVVPTQAGIDALAEEKARRAEQRN